MHRVDARYVQTDFDATESDLGFSSILETKSPFFRGAIFRSQSFDGDIPILKLREIIISRNDNFEEDA